MINKSNSIVLQSLIVNSGTKRAWGTISSTSLNKESSGWGKPVGDLEVDKRAAALWSLCPELELPTGVDSVVCDQSSCVQVCQTGMRSIGNRKTRCRWNHKRGFFWTKVRNYNVIIGPF